MITLTNEHDQTLYVMSGKEFFDELVQDAIDFDTSFWVPDADRFYTVSHQLVQVLDSQKTIERAVEYAKEYDYKGYQVTGITREILYGTLENTNVDSLIMKYWGASAFGSELEDETDDEENIEVYAIYNDDIDDYAQLGTLTIKHNEDFSAYKVYKDLIT